jgi:hypothetical protein
MHSPSEQEPRGGGLDLARSYVVFALVVQLLWLLYMTTRDLAGLEKIAGFYGARLPALVPALCGPLGWALVAVLTLLAMDAVRKLRVAPAYALAIHALVTSIAFGLFTWQTESTVFRMAASMANPQPVLPALAPSHDECATWLRHKYELLARESAYEVQEPSEGSILDCRQHLGRDELACGLRAESIEDLIECADDSNPGKVL